MSYAVLVLVCLITGVIAIAILCLVWHYLAPAHLRWVPQEDIEVVQTALFSGIIFSLLGSYVRDRVL